MFWSISNKGQNAHALLTFTDIRECYNEIKIQKKERKKENKQYQQTVWKIWNKP